MSCPAEAHLIRPNKRNRCSMARTLVFIPVPFLLDRSHTHFTRTIQHESFTRSPNLRAMVYDHDLVCLVSELDGIWFRHELRLEFRCDLHKRLDRVGLL